MTKKELAESPPKIGNLTPAKLKEYDQILNGIEIPNNVKVSSHHHCLKKHP